MKRTKGITALSIVFVLIGITSLLGSATYLSLGALLIGSLNLLMGISAMTVAVGLWKLKTWASQALVWWAIFCITRFIFIKLSSPFTPWLGVVIVITVFVAIAAALHRYVHRSLRTKPVWVKT